MNATEGFHDLDSKTQILLVTNANATPATHATKFAIKMVNILTVISIPKREKNRSPFSICAEKILAKTQYTAQLTSVVSTPKMMYKIISLYLTNNSLIFSIT